mmetsp:Transcript_20649/g.57005  ORF Transcript_20649/g.57005 Transcript_20649/m.57005 type:complete len:321 (-) Transcript_20649:1604-2566(-)
MYQERRTKSTLLFACRSPSTEGAYHATTNQCAQGKHGACTMASLWLSKRLLQLLNTCLNLKERHKQPPNSMSPTSDPNVAEDPLPLDGVVSHLVRHHRAPTGHPPAGIEVPHHGPETVLVELVHIPICQAIVALDCVGEGILGHHDLVPAVQPEISDLPDVFGKGLSQVPLVVRCTAQVVDVRREDDAPVVTVRERLPLLPPGQPRGPVHDDDWDVLVHVPPGCFDRLVVVQPQVVAVDSAAGGTAGARGLVQQLDAPANVTVPPADPGHLLVGPCRQVPVPIGVKVAAALVATGESIVCLAPRSTVQIQQYLQAMLSGK